MADEADIANDYLEREMKRQIETRIRYCGIGQQFCECSVEIPLELRQIGLNKCISC